MTTFKSAYQKLSEDCPEGISLDAWRSYALIVLMQKRFGKMIGPGELAARAELYRVDGHSSLDTERAEAHIRQLIAVDKLALGNGEWKHRGLPKHFA